MWHVSPAKALSLPGDGDATNGFDQDCPKKLGRFGGRASLSQVESANSFVKEHGRPFVHGCTIQGSLKQNQVSLGSLVWAIRIDNMGSADNFNNGMFHRS
jgi:hypothetical protein